MNWTEASGALRAAKSILLVAHVTPDGDAIGSLLGVMNTLLEMNRKVDAAVDEGVPEYLRFLPGAERVVASLDAGEWDLMIALDISDAERGGQVGAYGLAHSKTVLNLDHHPTNTRFGDIFLVDSQAVSATEIVFHWLEHMEHPLSPAVAMSLLTGLVTDTLGFRTSNVSADTLGIAHQLVAAGASLTEVTARALVNKPYSYIELWKYAFSSVSLEDAIISANVTQEDLKHAGLTDVTDGGLVSHLISVDEAMIAVVFKELKDGNIELSLRSRPGYDVSRAAFELGGGGHRQASGATVAGPLEAARARVLPLLRTAVKRGRRAIA